MELEWETILSSCIVGITTISGIFLKEFAQNSKNKKKACILTYTKQSENVEKAIRYILSEIGVDRAYVYEFHNGENFYSGSHQQKFSCTYESLNTGVSSESSNLQNLRVSTFNSFVKNVVRDLYFDASDVNDIANPLLRNWFEQRGVQSSYSIPIKTLNKNIIGILNVDYTKKRGQLTKKELGFIQNQAKIIGGYLI